MNNKIILLSLFVSLLTCFCHASSEKSAFVEILSSPHYNSLSETVKCTIQVSFTDNSNYDDVQVTAGLFHWVEGVDENSEKVVQNYELIKSIEDTINIRSKKKKKNTFKYVISIPYYPSSMARHKEFDMDKNLNVFANGYQIVVKASIKSDTNPSDRRRALVSTGLFQLPKKHKIWIKPAVWTSRLGRMGKNRNIESDDKVKSVLFQFLSNGQKHFWPKQKSKMTSVMLKNYPEPLVPNHPNTFVAPKPIYRAASVSTSVQVGDYLPKSVETQTDTDDNIVEKVSTETQTDSEDYAIGTVSTETQTDVEDYAIGTVSEETQTDADDGITEETPTDPVPETDNITSNDNQPDNYNSVRNEDDDDDDDDDESIDGDIGASLRDELSISGSITHDDVQTLPSYSDDEREFETSVNPLSLLMWAFKVYNIDLGTCINDAMKKQKKQQVGLGFLRYMGIVNLKKNDIAYGILKSRSPQQAVDYWNRKSGHDLQSEVERIPAENAESINDASTELWQAMLGPELWETMLGSELWKTMMETQSTRFSN